MRGKGCDEASGALNRFAPKGVKLTNAHHTDAYRLNIHKLVYRSLITSTKLSRKFRH